MVTPDVALDTMDEIENCGDIMMRTKEILQKAYEKHPFLYKYFAEEAKRYGEDFGNYAFPSALAYEIVTRQLDILGNSIDITSNDVVIHKESADVVFSDPRWKNKNWITERISTREMANADSGLGFFMNTLEIAAPELGELIAGTKGGIENGSDMKIFIRGIYDGFMPLYRKIIQQAELG